MYHTEATVAEYTGCVLYMGSATPVAASNTFCYSSLLVASLQQRLLLARSLYPVPTQHTEYIKIADSMGSSVVDLNSRANSRLL